MPSTRTLFLRHAAPAGALLGALLGAALVSLGGADASSPAPAGHESASSLEVTHVPPLLTAGTRRIELGFDAYCLPAGGDDAEAPCHVTGSAFVRAGEHGPYREVVLRDAPERTEGRLVAPVPADLARSPLGFSYYAVLEDRSTGAAVTFPDGGADAPLRSIPLGRAVEVSLGRHRFGAPRSASARIARASWGSGRGEVGLEQGRALPPIGGSSFDVGEDGTVHVLDEANRRVLRWRRGDAEPVAVPLAIDGTIADLAVGGDGALYVLETGSSASRQGLLRTFTAGGRATAAAKLAERAYRVQIGSGGAPVVLGQRSGQWLRAASRTGVPVALAEQRASGRTGRPLEDGEEVVVLREGREIRLAVLGRGDGRRAWRITSDTSLGEVQLAEPIGNRLVVVARVYDDSNDEFLVLVLAPQGVVSRFAVAASDWAETAPLSRFRLAGRSLFQLGSTPAGLFVDRYDLEVE